MPEGRNYRRNRACDQPQWSTEKPSHEVKINPGSGYLQCKNGDEDGLLSVAVERKGTSTISRARKTRPCLPFATVTTRTLRNW
jgi:hypothetical protein